MTMELDTQIGNLVFNVSRTHLRFVHNLQHFRGRIGSPLADRLRSQCTVIAFSPAE